MNLFQYLKDSRAELARVTWPSRQEVIEGTQAVLIYVVALTLIVFALDAVFGALVKAVLR
ncbi:preprotein translocase subunit SecE [Deinococcus hopiensis]|uniref:Protein translocase subunit SecE n=1 Tax=Deinococcus hopiensis KR-140 TaxID=695939 RepID=A0A1W1VKT6_9DEIO|nr:preprotein translocase subunit SecE [Deinococcus hopiensis]SMB93967.1 protein translocase subunit secE/sec61 gamma [Deinococcus hopiensis KR-140]